MTAQQPAAKKPGVNTQNRKSLLRKRAARLAAVQALYSMLLEDVKTTAQKLANTILGQWEDSKADGDGALPTDAMPDKTLLATVLETALENRAKLDGASLDVIFTAVAGGVLAVVVAVRRRRLSATLAGTARIIAAPSGARREIESAVPASRFAYGPAIAVGSVLAALIG